MNKNIKNELSLFMMPFLSIVLFWISYDEQVIMLIPSLFMLLLLHISLVAIYLKQSYGVK